MKQLRGLYAQTFFNFRTALVYLSQLKHELKTKLKNMVCRKEILRKYYGVCDNGYLKIIQNFRFVLRITIIRRSRKLYCLAFRFKAVKVLSIQGHNKIVFAGRSQSLNKLHKLSHILFKLENKSFNCCANLWGLTQQTEVGTEIIR
jgi:hypothetical protein